MSVLTLGEVSVKSGTSLAGHLDPSADVPVLAGLQTQGDVAIIPLSVVEDQVTVSDSAVWKDASKVGTVVSGIHNHDIVADPRAASWTTEVKDSEGLAVGVLDVADTAWLFHAAEHGGMGIGPGRYVIRRQREMADVWRTVAD